MKIRNDFVSNSSSCSFVISLPNESTYKLKDFIKNIANNCIKCKDENYEMSKEEKARLKEFNIRNLDYHLNSSELLFLGSIKLEDCTYVATKPKKNNDDYQYKLDRWNDLNKDIAKKDFGKDTGEKVIRANKSKIVISYPNYISQIVVKSMDIERLTGHYSFITPDKETQDDRKNAAENILNLLKSFNNSDDGWNMSYITNNDTYFISKETIWNTRALLENNVDIVFEDWENLDALEKRLNNGERLYVIRQNHSGDGWHNDAIYSIGGWESIIDDNLNVEIIHSETM